MNKTTQSIIILAVSIGLAYLMEGRIKIYSNIIKTNWSLEIKDSYGYLNALANIEGFPELFELHARILESDPHEPKLKKELMEITNFQFSNQKSNLALFNNLITPLYGQKQKERIEQDKSKSNNYTEAKLFIRDIKEISIDTLQLQMKLLNIPKGDFSMYENKRQLNSSEILDFKGDVENLTGLLINPVTQGTRKLTYKAY